MLAQFENGYSLEVNVIQYYDGEKEYEFKVMDDENCFVAQGYTEYRSIELYWPLDEIGYILEFCDSNPGIKMLKGNKYEIMKEETFEECLQKQGIYI